MNIFGETMNIAGSILAIIGAVFLAIGGFGVFRMPDVFNRIQAGTKATTLGAFSLVLGVGIAQPGWLLKIVLIIVFIAITNPVGSSVLARAAYRKQTGTAAGKVQKEGEDRELS